MAAPVVSFHVGGLEASVDEQSAVSAACAEVRDALAAHGIAAATAGQVPAAASFHAALAHVLERQAADAGAESARRVELAGRATRTAGLGSELVGDTTAVAGAAGPAGRRPLG
jgi:hypothetical protein